MQYMKCNKLLIMFMVSLITKVMLMLNYTSKYNYEPPSRVLYWYHVGTSYYYPDVSERLHVPWSFSVLSYTVWSFLQHLKCNYLSSLLFGSLINNLIMMLNNTFRHNYEPQVQYGNKCWSYKGRRLWVRRDWWQIRPLFSLKCLKSTNW